VIGRLHICGCYEGPFSREQPTPVFIPCDEHRDDPPRPSASVPLLRDGQGGYLLARAGQAVRL